jgi:hypothetical protein
VSFAAITFMLVLDECSLLLFISLSTQSGNFWIPPRTYVSLSNSTNKNAVTCIYFCVAMHRLLLSVMLCVLCKSQESSVVQR